MITVVFARKAERAILDASIWWRTHHTTNADLFDDELKRAVELIAIFPDAGERARTKRHKNTRIIVLRETGHLLLYRRETKARVRVTALLVSRMTAVRP
jgi:hypothetical protein